MSKELWDNSRLEQRSREIRKKERNYGIALGLGMMEIVGLFAFRVLQPYLFR